MSLIEDFEREYQRYHGITPKRAREQRALLSQLESRLSGTLDTATADDFASLLADLVASGLHVNTVRKKANMVRPFFSWMFAKGLITGDAYMRLKAVKDPRGATGNSKPRPYKRKELDQFFAAVEERLPLLPERGPGSQLIKGWLAGKGTPWFKIGKHAMRLQIDAIVALALHCGLRRAEIYQLKPDDLHYDNEYIVVVGKGGKVREVPFTEAARAAVQRWLDFRSSVIRPSCEETWLSCRGPYTYNQPMTFLRLEELLKRAVGPGWELHRFRHTFATERLRAGTPLEIVSLALGHATLEQTRAYAEIVRSDISRELAKTEGAFAERVANHVAA
jgi:site-specific recombinase XerD